MRIAFETLGCKLNQAETELLSRRFAAAGHLIVSPTENADIYILNTCTVTRTADAKSRHLLRLAHRLNPTALIAVTGCYAQRSPDELAKIEGVGFIIGNNEKFSIYSLLEDSGVFNKAFSVRESEGSILSLNLRTRSFIKIQDGCNNFCSYCIVPTVRGKEKSLPADLIIDEIMERVSEGYQEVVLTGTEIGTYTDNGVALTGLLERILKETGIARLRLSSLQPQEITPELVSLWQDSRLCLHFHLSLQSGSDSVLKRMNRRYNTSSYEKAVNSIRKAVPEVAITTDVIAGFPGETEKEFAESIDFIHKIGFSRLHVFSYSPRPETAASGMTNQVADSIKTQRNQILRASGMECRKSYVQQFQGRSMSILWEQRSGDTWSGYSSNYIKVYTKNDEDLTNRITPVKLQKLYRDGVLGEI